jgi:hypothetical protein
VGAIARYAWFGPRARPTVSSAFSNDYARAISSTPLEGQITIDMVMISWPPVRGLERRQHAQLAQWAHAMRQARQIGCIEKQQDCNCFFDFDPQIRSSSC